LADAADSQKSSAGLHNFGRTDAPSFVGRGSSAVVSSGRPDPDGATILARTSAYARVIALTAALAGLLRHDGPWAEAITRHTAAIQAAADLGEAVFLAVSDSDLVLVIPAVQTPSRPGEGDRAGPFAASLRPAVPDPFSAGDQGRPAGF
jgi:hypothetical protein